MTGRDERQSRFADSEQPREVTGATEPPDERRRPPTTSLASPPPVVPRRGGKVRAK